MLQATRCITSKEGLQRAVDAYRQRAASPPRGGVPRARRRAQSLRCSTPEMAQPVVVGGRVADKDGFRATVRYVGPVATSKSASTVYAGSSRCVARAKPSRAAPRSAARPRRFLD